MPSVGRFAPTTSGRAHPGTLLAGLLAWLDIRSQSGRIVLRLEDIDPSGARPEFRQGLLDDLTWFGLDWDEILWQSDCQINHHNLLDRLAATGRLYACTCTRSQIAAAGLASVAGGYRYPGTCRARRVTDWRTTTANLRIDLSDQTVQVPDESGLDLSQIIETAVGDPLLRRGDGSFAYMHAVVADDHAAEVNRVVRGRDLATSTATQVALYRLAGWEPPVYRHHLLLLEPRGEKLAKFHGAVGANQLRLRYEADELRGILAFIGGLRSEARPVSLGDLLGEFDWAKVRGKDQVLGWDGQALSTL